MIFRKRGRDFFFTLFRLLEEERKPCELLARHIRTISVIFRTQTHFYLHYTHKTCPRSPKSRTDASPSRLWAEKRKRRESLRRYVRDFRVVLFYIFDWLLWVCVIAWMGGGEIKCRGAVCFIGGDFCRSLTSSLGQNESGSREGNIRARECAHLRAFAWSRARDPLAWWISLPSYPA